MSFGFEEADLEDIARLKQSGLSVMQKIGERMVCMWRGGGVTC